MRKLLITVALALGMAFVGIAPTAAANKGFVVTCHGTASEKNPYVTIVTGSSAVNGHFDGTAPNHGKNNSPDILDGPTPTPGQGHGREFDECGGGE